MIKPLISRLLLENSNNSIQPIQPNLIRELGLVWNDNILLVAWVTLKVAKDV